MIIEEEITKNILSIEYFAEKILDIKLNDTQKEILSHYQNNSNSHIKKYNRGIGITTLNEIYFAHKLIFSIPSGYRIICFFDKIRHGYDFCEKIKEIILKFNELYPEYKLNFNIKNKTELQ